MKSATTSSDRHKTTLRFSGEDWRRIRANVEASGLTTNAYFRQLALQSSASEQKKRAFEPSVEGGQDRNLSVRLRPVEWAIVNHNASIEGLTRSAYVRRLVLEAPLPRKNAVRVPKVHAKVLSKWFGELGRIGNNVNQIAKNLNIAAKADGVIAGTNSQQILETVQAVEVLLAESAKDILEQLYPAEAA